MIIITITNFKYKSYVNWLRPACAEMVMIEVVAVVMVAFVLIAGTGSALEVWLWIGTGSRQLSSSSKRWDVVPFIHCTSSIDNEDDMIRSSKFKVRWSYDIEVDIEEKNNIFV